MGGWATHDPTLGGYHMDICINKIYYIIYTIKNIIYNQYNLRIYIYIYIYTYIHIDTYIYIYIIQFK